MSFCSLSFLCSNFPFISSFSKQSSITHITSHVHRRIHRLTITNTVLQIYRRLSVCGDGSSAALAVLAPFDALGKFKFKVKLGQGSVKRGTVVQVVRELLLHTEGATEAEKGLIKEIKAEDLTQTLVNDVKVLSSGAQQLQKAIKEDKKRQKKQQKTSKKDFFEESLQMKK